ncbi:titin homolog [Schistocerca serialis cubense]|uniref:titin homolog n=1 Tax=Schistocerca serialis cubense TaxID=2023355 RepID=UPI00214EDA57|nr:titin homolog [Schistocerca serialis cubense]
MPSTEKSANVSGERHITEVAKMEKMEVLGDENSEGMKELEEEQECEATWERVVPKTVPKEWKPEEDIQSPEISYGNIKKLKSNADNGEAPVQQKHNLKEVESGYIINADNSITEEVNKNGTGDSEERDTSELFVEEAMDTSGQAENSGGMGEEQKEEQNGEVPEEEDQSDASMRMETEVAETDVSQEQLKKKRMSGAQKRKMRIMEALLVGGRVLSKAERKKWKLVEETQKSETSNKVAKNKKTVTDSKGVDKKLESNTDEVKQKRKLKEANLDDTTTTSESDTMSLAVVPKGFPDIKMTEEQAEMLGTALVERINPSDKGEPIQFSAMQYENGGLAFTCANRTTKAWLCSTVPKIDPWPGAKLEVAQAETTLKGTKFVLWVIKGMNKRSNQQILDFVQKQNVDISTTEWKIIKRVTETDKRIRLTLWVDDKSSEDLKARNFKVFLGITRARFMRMSEWKKLMENVSSKKQGKVQPAEQNQSRLPANYEPHRPVVKKSSIKNSSHTRVPISGPNTLHQSWEPEHTDPNRVSEQTHDRGFGRSERLRSRGGDRTQHKEPRYTTEQTEEERFTTSDRREPRASSNRDLPASGSWERRASRSRERRASSSRSSSRERRASSSRSSSRERRASSSRSSSRERRASSSRERRASSSRERRASSSRERRGSRCREHRGSRCRKHRGSRCRKRRASDLRDRRTSDLRELLASLRRKREYRASLHPERGYRASTHREPSASPLRELIETDYGIPDPPQISEMRYTVSDLASSHSSRYFSSHQDQCENQRFIGSVLSPSCVSRISDLEKSLLLSDLESTVLTSQRPRKRGVSTSELSQSREASYIVSDRAQRREPIYTSDEAEEDEYFTADRRQSFKTCYEAPDPPLISETSYTGSDRTQSRDSRHLSPNQKMPKDRRSRGSGKSSPCLSRFGKLDEPAAETVLLRSVISRYLDSEQPHEHGSVTTELSHLQDVRSAISDRAQENRYLTSDLRQRLETGPRAPDPPQIRGLRYKASDLAPSLNSKYVTPNRDKPESPAFRGSGRPLSRVFRFGDLDESLTESAIDVESEFLPSQQLPERVFSTPGRSQSRKASYIISDLAQRR